MKWLKRIGIGLVAIVALAAIVGLLMPAKLVVSESIVIHRPAEGVYPLAANLRKWPTWSNWHREDTTIQNTFEGPDAQVGQKMTFATRDGNGSVTLTNLEANKQITYDMVFNERGTSRGVIEFAAAAGGTQVTWGLESDETGNPFARIFLQLFEGRIADDFKKGLGHLKALAEEGGMASLTTPALAIDTLMLPAVKYVFIRGKVKPAALGDSLGAWYGRIQAQGITPVGPPMSITYSFSPEVADLAAALPVAARQPVSPPAQYAEAPERRVAHARHVGSYNSLANSHSAILEWFRLNNKSPKGEAWEYYVTDPGQQPDSTKWVTEIYYPY